MNPKQIIILVVAVVALGGGVGYVVTTLGSGGTKIGEDLVKAPPPQKSPLEIVTEAQGTRYEEAMTAGHYAFRYRNKEDKSLTVGVNWKNCKCAKIEICSAPDDWKTLDEATFAMRKDDSSLDWKTLDKDGKGFEVPPGGIGWVRLGWKGDKLGEERFTADLWLFQPDSGVGHRLEVPVNFVEAVRVRAEDDQDRVDAYVGRMPANERRTAKFHFWSSTREKFTLKAEPPKDDPCITYGEPTPLTAAEMAELTKRHGRKVLSGYSVEVAITERAGNQQLDLGPFHRRLSWRSEAVKEPIRAHINGIVLGEVVMVSGDEPRIDMGAIVPSRPAPFEFVLETDNPTVELTLDKDRTTEFLQVESPDGPAGKLEKVAGSAARKTWKMTVSYRPDSGFQGPFPDPDRQGFESCGIVFKISHAGVKNEQERRIKIPVRGQVKNQ